MPDRSEFVSLVKALATVAAIACTVAVALWLVWRPRRLMPPQRWRAVAWSGWHCGLACLLLILFSDLVTAALDSQGVASWVFGKPTDKLVADRLARYVAGLITLPGILLGWWLLLWPWSAGRPFRLGGSRDAILGVVAWMGVGPLVYVVNMIALVIYGAVYGSPPKDHPLLELLRNQGTASMVWTLVLVESIIAAPIREELLFRGILQPWFSRDENGGPHAFAWAALVGIVFRSLTITETGLGRAVSLAAPVLLVAVIVPVALRVADLFGRPQPPVALLWLLPLRDPDQRRRAVLGIFGTAALFANVHAAVWPTPVPLFVLGLGLGWLAMRTQGVIAPIVCHAFFNAVACVEMYYLAR